jgi:2,3-bisphosphoglycerate-independent phosphoglycerate mutase
VVKRPLVLIIRDGWGVRKAREGNATLLAQTPVHSNLLQTYPFTQLNASGESVGLPAGIMGNSEVGHINLGAGRIVVQESTLISREIRNGNFFSNSALISAVTNAINNQSKLHLMGLCSDALVHSALEHLFGLLTLAARNGLRRVFLHAFLDGRDTMPKEAAKYITQVENRMRDSKVGKIASICGRYYAMDRDKRWDRIQKAYLMLTQGEGFTARTALEGLQNAYNRGETDEFVKPTALVDSVGRPIATVSSNDSVIFFNFRADRGRQMTRAFTEPDFTDFKRAEFINPHFVTLTEYEKSQKARAAFAPQVTVNTLGEVLAAHNMRQLRIAETEKYAHVTFFFNSGREAPNTGEDRVLIPSPRIATYDLKPEMSALEVTAEVKKRIDSGVHDVIILNFANPDMVGHTGVLEAAIKAVETVDYCVGEVLSSIRRAGGRALVSADHGNCEMMIDPETGGPHTAHTTNPVQFILVDDDMRGTKLSQSDDLALADVAPTILHLLSIPPPPQMKGRNIILT